MIVCATHTHTLPLTYTRVHPFIHQITMFDNAKTVADNAYKLVYYKRYSDGVKALLEAARLYRLSFRANCAEICERDALAVAQVYLGRASSERMAS